MQPLDDPRYPVDTHIETAHLERFNAGEMGEEEQDQFLYHLDECKECAAKLRAWIIAGDMKMPGPSSDGSGRVIE